MQPDPRIPLKNPWIAGVLAYLVPGAGHCYQGRYFKAILYFVCITGTFLQGFSMGDWKIVHFDNKPLLRNLGFFAQSMVGCTTLPALIQSRRYDNPENVSVNTLHKPLSAPFQGYLKIFKDGNKGEVQLINGKVMLVPIDDQNRFTVQGEFSGVNADQNPVTFTWQEGSLRHLDQPISGDPDRLLMVDIMSSTDFPRDALLEGSIPRPWYNWLEVPLDNEQMDRLHGKLGKFYEFAVLYTWIAGLLNVLAIWDAIDGPAYGYGDEEPAETENETDTKSANETEADNKAKQKAESKTTKNPADPVTST